MLANDPEHEAYLAWERRHTALAFHRTDERKTKLKRRCDCAHWIDGGEPYRYQVWKFNCDTEITQRLDCEFCARVDQAA